MAAQASKTRSSTPRLSEIARQVVVPTGITKTAWPAVVAEARRLGFEFDPWQDGAGRLILAKRADGSYAATIGGIVISIPRQVGKTFLIGVIVFALCMLHPGLTVVWTAHQLKTAGETFRAMQAMARRPKVFPHIRQIFLGSGDEAIEFVNGSRVLFGARERGFGLGFTKVDVLVLDEAQRVTEKTMDDLVPTTNQASNPLIFLMGTPPRPTDNGEVFRSRRREALSGQSEDMVYIEFSAPPDTDPSSWPAKHVDWAAVAEANPSFPARTKKPAILRMLKNLGRESFRREGLGIWDDDRARSNGLSTAGWKRTAIPEDAVPADGVPCYAVTFSADGMRLALAGAVRHDGGVHVEQIDAYAGAIEGGLAPLADWFTARVDGVPRWRRASAIVLSGRAGASTLAQLLADRGVPPRIVKVATTPNYYDACSMFADAIDTAAKIPENETPEVTHKATGQQPLDESVTACEKRARGTGGAWGWHSTIAGGDETPLEAVSLAYWAARTTKRRRERSEKRKAVIV